jgi:hypothetical protein
VRFLALVALVVSMGVITSGASARSDSYAFAAHDVFVHQGLLAHSMDYLFPSLAPIQVKCWGVGAVTLRGGGRGYNTIRCTVSLQIPDFIYHLDARGNQYVTRIRP